MPERLRVLCLDMETGLGGSSRSLLQSLIHMDRRRVAVEVWRGARSPIEKQLDAHGIPWRIPAGLPKVKAVRRPSRNLVILSRALIDFWRFRSELATLAGDAGRRFDIVHFNLDSMTAVAAWLRRQVRTPMTMHLRSILPTNSFARWQAATIGKTMTRLVAISENERDNLLSLAPQAPAPRVVYNIVDVPSDLPTPLPEIPGDGRFTVASLSNFVWARGTDRLIDVAAELAGRGRRDIRFVIAGTIELSGYLPGQLGRIAERGGTLRDYAADRGVDDMFVFLGHVAEPERVLAACDVLVKPTREANPWGRDILEAMAYGKPVLSVGIYNRFVETDVTGLLQSEFNVIELAQSLIRLADDRAGCRRLGQNGKERVAQLCSGSARAADLLAIWEDAAGR